MYVHVHVYVIFLYSIVHCIRLTQLSCLGVLVGRASDLNSGVHCYALDMFICIALFLSLMYMYNVHVHPLCGRSIYNIHVHVHTCMYNCVNILQHPSPPSILFLFPLLPALCQSPHDQALYHTWLGDGWPVTRGTHPNTPALP